MERIVSRLTGTFVCVCLLALGGATAASARNAVHGAAARQERFHHLLSSGAVQPQATQDNHVPDSDEAAISGAYDFERTAPAQTVSGQALISAQQQAQGLGQQGPAWQLFTTQPYNAEPAGYTDPLESNNGAGFGLVGGRITSLVQAPGGSWFARRCGRRRVALTRPGPDLDPDVRLAALALYWRARRRPGRRIDMGWHG